jgi:hypothetical protein
MELAFFDVYVQAEEVFCFGGRDAKILVVLGHPVWYVALVPGPRRIYRVSLMMRTISIVAHYKYLIYVLV